MVSQENIDQQHESRGYWIVIGIILFIFLLLTRYALTKVAVSVQIVRNNMRNRLGPVLVGGIILIAIFFAVLFLLNQRSKRQDWQSKK